MTWYDDLVASTKPTISAWQAFFLHVKNLSFDDLTLTDSTINDVSTTKHGLCPKLDNNPHHFLRSDGLQAAPPGSGGVGGNTGAVDGAILLADGVEGDMVRAATQTIVTALGDDDASIPTSKAVKDACLAASSAANGRIYIGKADGTFALVNITPGANITITNADGAITIAAASGGVTFAGVSGTTQQAAVNNGYIPLNAALTTITLPATAAVGDVVAITGGGAGLWKLAQNASQIVHFFSLTTTTGTGGCINATSLEDCIVVRCIVANTTWVVENAVGNLDVI